MFFSFFPSLQYDSSFLVDLSRRIQAIEIDDPKFLYDEYVVQDGERPDALSNRFYEVPYFHWVLLVTNGLTLQTWPKSERRFEEYISNKYQGTEHQIGAYLDSEGNPVPPTFPESIETPDGQIGFWFNGDGLGAVKDGIVHSVGGVQKTFLELEREANDARSIIRVLDRSHLGNITDLARSLLGRTPRWA